MGTAFADEIIVQTSPDVYTIYLDPALVNNSGTIRGTGGVVYGDIYESSGTFYYSGTYSSDISYTFTSLSVSDGFYVHFSPSTVTDANIVLTGPYTGANNFSLLVDSSSLVPINITLNENNFETVSNITLFNGPYGNVHISNLNISQGDLIISGVNASDVSVSVKNSSVNGSVIISRVNDSSSPSGPVTVSNLTLTSGTLALTDIIATDITISNSNLIASSPTSELLLLNNISADSASISGMNIENGSLFFNHTNFVYPVSIFNNTISNDSYVLEFDELHTDVLQIYNNKFVIGTGINYANIISSSSIYFNEVDPFGVLITPHSGRNIVGGPYIAGNYWTTLVETGYSDMLTATSTGYSDVPYPIPISGSGSFTDNYPLTKYTAPPSGGGTGSPVVITTPPVDPPSSDPQPGTPLDPVNPPADPVTPGNPTPAGSGFTAGSGGIHGTLKTLKEEDMPTDEVVSDYIAPAAVIIGAAGGTLLILIISLIDTFFDATSAQVRGSAKGRFHLKFNPPKWADIISARFAFMVLMFFVGVCIVDTILADTVDKAMNGGLLTFLAAIIPPIFVIAFLNIGGGLFIDEILDYILERTGKYARKKTRLLDVIDSNRKINIAVFFVIVVVAIALVTFFTLFLDWTLL
ncbi:hypothetical protein [Methanolapillus africanus]